MKKDWQIVYDMVNGTNTSGFGYDSSIHSVTVEPTVHKDAGKWRNKIFPHYEDLCIIFGKDRVQGNKAKDFSQMEEDANNEEQSDQIEDAFKNKPHKMKNLQTPANNINQATLREIEVQKSFNGDFSEISKMQSLGAFDRFKESRKIMHDPETISFLSKTFGEVNVP
uniref:Uncharacterized protein n=1 Tax=Lactuca sativa TaxID=4236 RepID=A0A9R1V797_LACSA|nr:hypothetical protein LSAT_V11C600322370 [Lactuca sativa]